MSNENRIRNEDGQLVNRDPENGEEKPLPVKSLQTDQTNTERGPKPGDVQAAIDAAANAGGGRVQLWPEKVYDPSSTWDVKSGVVLDFSGAWVNLSSDIDVMRLRDDSRVLNPQIDATGIGYTSNVFRIDADVDDTIKNNTKMVWGGTSLGDPGQGTCFYLVSRGGQSSPNGGQVGLNEFRHNCIGFNKGIHLYNDDPNTADGWVNGNRFYGVWDNCTTIIHTEEDPNAKFRINGNIFDGLYQPNNDTDRVWWCEYGEHNLLTGEVWDPSRADVVAFEFGSSAQGKNVIWSPIYGPSVISNNLTDNSGSPSNGYFLPHMLAGTSTSGTQLGFESVAENLGTALGWKAKAGSSGVAIGWGAENASGGSGTAVGRDAVTNASLAVALGRDAVVNTQGVGRVAVDQLVFGGVQNTIADADLNNEELTVEADETNSQFVLRYKDSNGTVQTATLAW